MVFGVYMSHYETPVHTCSYLQVQIMDQAERQYVTDAEIKQLVLARGLSPISKPSNKIALQAIEDMMRQHPMIRTAECYETMQGDVCIRLTQRVPLVRIMTGAETYFIDTDRRVMPVRESVKAPVLIVTGAVNKRMAAHEISDFAEWLQKDPYWKPRVVRAEVHNYKMVYVIQRQEGARILLGDFVGAAQKMNKLQHWYEAGKSLDLSQYAEVDLRFHGQVIGIRSRE